MSSWLSSWLVGSAEEPSETEDKSKQPRLLQSEPVLLTDDEKPMDSASITKQFLAELENKDPDWYECVTRETVNVWRKMVCSTHSSYIYIYDFLA